MNQELMDRIELIERMVQDGRRTTQYWGWVSLLWGIGQLVALGWMAIFHQYTLPWLVTMPLCGVIMGVVAWLKTRRREKSTTMARAISAVWISVGISLFFFFFTITSLKIDFRFELAIFYTLLATGNMASGLIIRWWIQIGLAVLWWAAAWVTLFAPTSWAGPVYLVMVIVGQVAFGILLMVLEKRHITHGSNS